MKKIYMILAALAVVFGAVSCNKEDMTAGSGEPMVVKFTAKAADVKAQFNPTSYENGAAVPVLWDGGENLSIAVGDKDARDFARNCAEVVASDDKRSATWEYDFSGLVTDAYAPEAPFTFHAFCGSVRAYRNSSVSRVLLNNIPSEQTPGENSCDPKAIYLYSKSAEYQAWPSEVEMNPFEHLTAYGCITLGTGIPEDETIQSLTITADASTHLSGGAWYYYATGNKYADYTGTDAQTPRPSSSITLKPAEGGALSRENLWFGCRPTTELASLKFTVTTDKGVYEVVKNELGGRNFQAGKVAKMIISGFEKVEDSGDDDENVVAYWFDAADVLNLLGGSKTYNANFENTVSHTPEGGPSLVWNSTGTLAGSECKLSVPSGRVKFGTGSNVLNNLKITITPQEGWIIQSVNINAAIASGKAYQLTAKVGDVTLIDAALNTSDIDYSGENTGAGPLEVSIDATTAGVFYISNIAVELIPASAE